MTHQGLNKPASFREWTEFLSTLNGKKDSDQPLLRKTATPDRLLMSLEKEFANLPQPQIFRRLGKHTQLVLNFYQS